MIMIIEGLTIGTGNKGKARELAAILAPLDIPIRDLSSFGFLPEPEETGATFAENAVIKAREYAKLTGSCVLADDSGLEVEALTGLPGVRSARYARIGASDEENIKKLLEELKDIPEKDRVACFVCEMAVAEPEGSIMVTATGTCPGLITLKPRGHNGFGYDPVFIPEGFEETFGELPDSIKNEISHRTVAARQIRDFFAKSALKPT